MPGCKDNDLENTIPDKQGNIRFYLQVQNLPGQPGQEPETRAVTPVNDGGIETIDVLAFTRISGTAGQRAGQWKYFYTAPAVKGLGDFYNVPLQLSTDDQCFVFVANARSYIGANANAWTGQILDLTDTDSGTDAPFLKLLEMDQTDWFATSTTGDTKYIPMYGEPLFFNPITLSTNELNNAADPIKLTRMLARIDIKEETPGEIKDTSNGGTDKYQLKEAYLFQRKAAGQLTYPQQHMPTGADYVTKPWVPDNCQLHYRSDGYAVETGGLVQGNHVTGRIYTFETEDATTLNTDRLQVAAIVVGLQKKNSSDPTIYYYRIDIPQFEDDGTVKKNTMGPMMRNHCYTLSIKSVLGEGELTPEEGYEGRTKIEAYVVPWETNKMEVDYGDDDLWVSKTYIKIPSYYGI